MFKVYAPTGRAAMSHRQGGGQQKRRQRPSARGIMGQRRPASGK